VELYRPAPQIRIRAALAYGNPMQVSGVWTGALRSETVTVLWKKGKAQ